MGKSKKGFSMGILSLRSFLGGWRGGENITFPLCVCVFIYLIFFVWVWVGGGVTLILYCLSSISVYYF